MAVKPIKPGDVAEQQLPDEVLEAFNEFIIANFQNGSSSFYRGDVIRRIVAKGQREDDILKYNWFQRIIEIYRDAGWKVVYDRPGYNELYEPFFTFKTG